jgi:hypothetical protein
MPRPTLPRPRLKLSVSVDRETIQTLEKIRKTVDEIDGPSAAVRYLARWYERTMVQQRGQDGP